jgi:ribonucleoside-diphosphate reductase beta chain
MSTTNKRVFATTSTQGLRQDLPPMRLWQKAKRLGIWNPSDIDFTQDKIDWQNMNDLQRGSILRLCSLFQAGEESVTLDLLPLIMLIAREGRLEEEMYLTSFLWEEAKHVDGFRRFLDEVAEEHGDLTRFHTPAYRKVFYEELPSAMNSLLTDTSVEAQVRASTTYNMFVEGVMAETGYYSFSRMLTANNLMPGMQQFVTYLKRDESRHIAFAIYYLSRLMAEYGDRAWNTLEERMNELLPYALSTNSESYDVSALPEEERPFNITVEETNAYAIAQFTKRMDRLARARGQSLEEINQLANTLDESLA